MCILFIMRNQHPEYPLIIAANRDEYHARPSRTMHWWDDQPHILAGRDLKAGGTWLGITQSNRFAAVTNLRSGIPSRDEARSRGELVIRCLDTHQSPETAHHFLQTEQSEYNPFNLVFGDQSDLFAWKYGENEPIPLNGDFHSISNGPLETIWPKMSRGMKQFSEYLSTQTVVEPDMLLPIMLDTSQPPENELPNSGLTAERERQLSSIFIQGTDYGTRTTTILLFGKETVRVAEYDHSPDQPMTGSREFEIPAIQTG